MANEIMFEQVRDVLKRAEKIVIVTGAGISQESGIPTFRGKDGLWRNYDAMQLATIDAFYDNPKLVWEWYTERRANIFEAKPNPGHDAISELEKHCKCVILTQNIDGLHQRAGSSDVYELHGSIVRIKCTVCDYVDDITGTFDVLPPKCKCGEILRPDVVWFGESLPQNIWQSAIKEASACDVMIIVGTSLVVSPANTLPVYAKQNGAILIEVNPEKTVMSNDMSLSVQATSVETLPKLLSIFKNE